MIGEKIVKQGIECTHSKTEEGTIYYLANLSMKIKNKLSTERNVSPGPPNILVLRVHTSATIDHFFSVADLDLHNRIFGRLLRLGPIFFIFMQFSANVGQIFPSDILDPPLLFVNSKQPTSMIVRLILTGHKYPINGRSRAAHAIFFGLSNLVKRNVAKVFKMRDWKTTASSKNPY